MSISQVIASQSAVSSVRMLGQLQLGLVADFAQIPLWPNGNARRMFLHARLKYCTSTKVGL
jgi:hypothetical protein